MPDSICVETPENQSNADVRLDPSFDATGGLSLSVSGEELASANSQLEVKCDETQTVRIFVPDFEHDNETWTVAATPKTRDSAGGNWDQGQAIAYDEDSGHMTDYGQVDVTASTTGESRTQRIYIKTKPRGSGGDPPIQAP